MIPKLLTAALVGGMFLVLGWQGIAGGIIIGVLYELGYRAEHGEWRRS